MPELSSILKKHNGEFAPIVPFNPTTDSFLPMDFSEANTELTEKIFSYTPMFENYVTGKLKAQKATYGIGGYAENRVVYRRSELFNNEGSRTLHLGIDIWGEAGTKVIAPLGGMVHSLAFNNGFGDYGATIILQHQLETMNFYTLYGHLSLADIQRLRKGQFIIRGQEFAHFGVPEENGNWPPHLHFQLITDMRNYEGDYPGVCKISEADKWLRDSPDPSPLLNFGQLAAQTYDLSQFPV